MASQIENDEVTRKNLIANFVQAVACHADQAQKYLIAAQWDFEVNTKFFSYLLSTKLKIISARPIS